MIIALLLTLIAALALATSGLIRLARALVAADQLIAELHRGRTLDAEALRLRKDYIALLEGRNALLEWEVTHYVHTRPRTEGTRALAEAKARVCPN